MVCFPVILGLAYSTNSSINTGHAPAKKKKHWCIIKQINDQLTPEGTLSLTRVVSSTTPSISKQNTSHDGG